MDDWDLFDAPEMPTGPHHFPPSGPNSLARLSMRAAARAIDSLLIGFPVLVVVVIVMGASGTGGTATVPRWASLAWFVLAIVYETLMVAWHGQTVGKLAVGIKVARIDNGRPPLWWQAAIRIALPAASAALPFQYAWVVYLGEYTTGFWNPTHRAWHDLAAGTVVVATR